MKYEIKELTRMYVCYKKNYSTRKKALSAGARASIKVSVYKCPKCRYWHLTSKRMRRKK